MAGAYEPKLHDLIAGLRAELHAPAVPFVAGQLGRFSDRPWNDFKTTVDRAHRELPRKVTHTAFVGSSGLKHKGDKVHFDADSSREFGQRYADAYLELVRTQ